MTDRRLCEDVFRSSSEKVTVHSSEIFDEGVLLGFRAPTTFEARQMSPGEPQLFITISRDEMDELCDYWQGLNSEIKTPKSYLTKIVKEGEEYLLILPDDLMKEAGYAIDDEFEVEACDGTIILKPIPKGGQS